eukprot:2794442-Amphidinium_carterae.1
MHAGLSPHMEQKSSAKSLSDSLTFSLPSTWRPAELANVLLQNVSFANLGSQITSHVFARETETCCGWWRTDLFPIHTTAVTAQTA